MTSFEKPSPSGEYVTAEGHIKLSNEDIIGLLEMAQEAGSHAFGSFTYALEAAYRNEDPALGEEISRLQAATLGNGIVHLGRYWQENAVHLWEIPLLDADGRELTDQISIHTLNLRDMTMLCYGLGPEVEDEQGIGFFSHHVVFKASYMTPEQMIPVLWNTGEDGTHPDIPALEAEFMGTPPEDDKALWIENKLRSYWHAHNQKIKELKAQIQQPIPAAVETNVSSKKFGGGILSGLGIFNKRKR